MNTWVRWAVISDGIAVEYDDEQDARAHLGDYPDSYVARCLVTKTPWERVP